MDKKKHRYESPTTTMSLLQSEGTLLIASGISADNIMSSSLSVSTSQMQFIEGDDYAFNGSTYSSSFKTSWEEE